MNEELAALRDEVRAGFAGLRAEVGSLRAEVTTLDERVRHNGVLIEAVRDDVRQLAEAHVMFDQRVERYRQENETAHAEILGLLRTSHRDLDRRVTRLEGRAAGPQPDA